MCNLEICAYVTVCCTLVSSLGQVPLSVCSSICPPGTRKAIRPNFPICCHDCVVCAAGEISNHTGEERKRLKKVTFDFSFTVFEVRLNASEVDFG